MKEMSKQVTRGITNDNLHRLSRRRIEKTNNVGTHTNLVLQTNRCNLMEYVITLRWAPKRGPISYKIRYYYATSKRKAWKKAKEIIVKQDSRLKVFAVAIRTKIDGPATHLWYKSEGKIVRDV